jgi:hypothetical protein
MNRNLRTSLAIIVALFLCVTGSLMAGEGTHIPIEFTNGIATVHLDSSDSEYSLVLFCRGEDAGGEYNYLLTPESQAIAFVTRSIGTSFLDDREDQIIAQEQVLVQNLQEDGGLVTRRSVPSLELPLIGSLRNFTFSAMGDVREDQNVRARLVAVSDNTLGYLDTGGPSLPENVSPDQVRRLVERFTTHTYPQITSAFGNPSDVDRDGKVLFLFTHLVDRVRGPAGFFSSTSLFSEDVGGNGNQADMMFISPTRRLPTYDPLLAHEFQHLINFNEHVIVGGGEPEASWMSEALAHVAEDLVDAHVTGGNPELLTKFMMATEKAPLTASALFNKPVRGIAYLFVRSLMEDFGEEVLARLANSGFAGVAGIEEAAGTDFDSLYQRFTRRLYLAGSGLPGSGELGFQYPFLVEPESGARSLPPPMEEKYTVEGGPIRGSLAARTVRYFRLSRPLTPHTFQIVTDPAGNYGAYLIPLPKGFVHPMALARDYYPGIVLDKPLVGKGTAGVPIRIAGRVHSKGVSNLLLQFSGLETIGDTLVFEASVDEGRFSRSVLFPPTKSGTYSFSMLAKRSGPLFEGITTPFQPVKISEAQSDTFHFPEDFFPGVRLDEPLPGVYDEGEVLKVAGTVLVPEAREVMLRFVKSGTPLDTVQFQSPVAGNRFERSVLFAPGHAGRYAFDFLVKSRGPLFDGLGPAFEPVTIRPGEDSTFYFDRSFFSGITFDEPLPGLFVSGEPNRISGSVSDPSVSQLLMVLEPEDGLGVDSQFSLSIEGGRFGQSLLFSESQVGQYVLRFFMGEEGTSLPFVDSFGPVFVKLGEGEMRLPVDYFSGVILGSLFPSHFDVGSGFSFFGKVSDPAVKVLLLGFRSEQGGQDVQVQVRVREKTFRKGFVFSAIHEGVYTIDLYGGEDVKSLPFLGTFSPVHVENSGGLPVKLPVDSFDGLLLDVPLQAEFVVGQSVTISGDVHDSEISQVGFSFVPTGKGKPIDRFVSVQDGRFTMELLFEEDEKGSRKLQVFGGPVGKSLAFLGGFDPVVVK